MLDFSRLGVNPKEGRFCGLLGTLTTLFFGTDLYIARVLFSDFLLDFYDSIIEDSDAIRIYMSCEEEIFKACKLKSVGRAALTVLLLLLISMSF